MIEIILFISGIIITVVMGILSWFTRNKIEQMEKQLDKLNEDSKQLSEHEAKIISMNNNISIHGKDIKEFRDNYLDRFEAMNNIIYDSKIEILKEINKLYLKIK